MAALSWVRPWWRRPAPIRGRWTSSTGPGRFFRSGMVTGSTWYTVRTSAPFIPATDPMKQFDRFIAVMLERRATAIAVIPGEPVRIQSGERMDPLPREAVTGAQIDAIL